MTMTYLPDDPAGEPHRCPRCDQPLEALLPADHFTDRIDLCRNPEHTLPLLSLVPPDSPRAIEIGSGAGISRIARRIAGRVVDLERELSEIIRTGRSTSARVKAEHGAGRTSLPEGAVAGTRIGPDDRMELVGALRALAWEIQYRGDQLDRERIRRVVDRAARMFGEYGRTRDEWRQPAGGPYAAWVADPPVIITAEDGNLGIAPLDVHPAEMTDAPRPPLRPVDQPPILVDHDLPANVVGVEDHAGEIIASIDYAGATFEDLELSGIDEIAAGAGSAVLGVGDDVLNPPADRVVLHPTSRLAGTISPTGRPDLDVPCGACSCGWHGPFGHPNHATSEGTHRWAEHLGRRVFVSECKATGPAIQIEVDGLGRLT